MDEERASGLRGLAGRLLATAVGFVLAVEFFLALTSLGAYRSAQIQERVQAAALIARLLEEAPNPAESRTLLAEAGLDALVIDRAGARLVLGDPPRAAIPVERVSAIGSLFSARDAWVAIDAQSGAQSATAYVREHRLRDGLRRSLVADIGGSLTLIAIVGFLLYVTLLLVVVRRMQALTAAIETFRRKPFDASVPLDPGVPDDEISWAKRAFAEMQDEIRLALRQRERLAALGAAVGKIAHDLRNVLSTAQLATGRLADSDDPRVRNSAPRLERAIARAAALADAASRYGKGEDPAPQIRSVALARLVEEAGEAALEAHAHAALEIDIEPWIMVRADPEHVYRIIENLLRNAAEAMAARGSGLVRCSAATVGDTVAIDVEDNGPGIADHVREHLFEPFAAGGPHGLGLGLSSSREMARANGGDLALLRSTPEGACFRLTLKAGG